jgi:hypothetical protein
MFSMILASFVESSSVFLAILTPLVAVPLTVITFYLRSLREHQLSRHADLAHRFDLAEAAVAELRKTLVEFERDYTTKEEWLRECMLARRTLEQLSETTVRIETTVKGLTSHEHPWRGARHRRTTRATEGEESLGTQGERGEDD